MSTSGSVGVDSIACELFLRCINVDEIDRDLDDVIEVDPYVSGTSSRRSDKELAHMLDLIDSLPISTNGEDGQK